MKKGFTILELLVSIIILSVVLTFAMNLFLRVRSAYTNSKSNVNMEISKSIVIDSVMSDVNKYVVKSVSCTSDTATLQFEKENEIITKQLIFDSSDSRNDYIKYNTVNSNEAIVRKLPNNTLIGPLSCTFRAHISIGKLNHLYFKVIDSNGNDYSIDIFIVSQN